MNETKFHHVIMYLTFFSLGMIMSALAISQGFFKELVFVLFLGALFLMFSLIYNWVRGIDYMQENHPDYKGEDMFGDDK